MPPSSKRTAASFDQSEATRKVKFRKGAVTDQRSQSHNNTESQRQSDNRDASDSEDDDEVERGLEKAVRARICFQQRVGAAFYDSKTSTLSFLEDTADSSMFDMSVALMEQLEPSYIITGNSSNEKLIEAIIAYCEEHDDCQYHVRPTKEYTLSAALARLSHLRITQLGDDQDMSRGRNDGSSDDESGLANTRVENNTGQGWEMDEENARKLAMLRLGCFTNIEAHLSLCASGALLLQLEKMRTAKNLTGAVSIMRSVETIKLSQHMLINADALTSLSIFDAQQQSSSSHKSGKGGFSLFSLLNTCSTGQGAALLKRWLQRPLSDIGPINDRHQSVAVFHRHENRVTSAQLGKLLKRMARGIHNILNRTERLDPNDWKVWKDLVDYSFTAIMIRDGVCELHDWDSGSLCPKIVANIDHEDLHDLAEMLSQAVRAGYSSCWASINYLYPVTLQIDFNSSQQDNRVCIQSGVDDTIDELSQLIEGLGSTLGTAAVEVLSDIASLPLPRQFADLSVHLLPQLGYLIQVDPGDVEVLQYPEGWQLQFHDDDGKQYFKETKMRELDESLGDLLGQHADRTVDILEKVCSNIRNLEPALLKIDEVIAELDCVLALASACQTFNLVRPRMVDDNVLLIKGGRHILYEMANETYVSNDTDLRGRQPRLSKEGDESAEPDESSLMILTGANGSGKSAYGKQVAMIAFMAQIGCYVPAEEAILGPVDKLYTRMQTKESTSKAASAFMIDLSQVSMMLRGATARSLLVLDEFGKGTLSQDGAGLLAGTLTEFLARGADCPKIIAITHFHEIFQRHIAGVDFTPFAWQMKTHFQDQQAGDEGVSFLFQLEKPKDMKDLHSHAAECALYYGVPPAVIERAKKVTECIATQDIGKIVEAVEISPSEALELQQAEALTRAFIRWDLSDDGDDTGRTMEALREMIEAANQSRGDSVV